jgi:hypothetical protein
VATAWSADNPLARVCDPAANFSGITPSGPLTDVIVRVML